MLGLLSHLEAAEQSQRLQWRLDSTYLSNPVSPQRLISPQGWTMSFVSL